MGFFFFFCYFQWNLMLLLLKRKLHLPGKFLLTAWTGMRKNLTIRLKSKCAIFLGGHTYVCVGVCIQAKAAFVARFIWGWISWLFHWQSSMRLPILVYFLNYFHKTFFLVLSIPIALPSPKDKKFEKKIITFSHPLHFSLSLCPHLLILQWLFFRVFRLIPVAPKPSAHGIIQESFYPENSNLFFCLYSFLSLSCTARTYYS